MKKYMYFLSLIIFAFSILPNFSFCQTTYVIQLSVNTQDIINPDVDNYCSFGQASEIDNKDFTIDVNVGDIILWEGVSSNAPTTDVVRIVSIDHEAGPNFFGVSNLINNGQSDFIMGRVNSGNSGETQKYTLRFNVFNNGTQRNGVFVIDPKIKIR